MLVEIYDETKKRPQYIIDKRNSTLINQLLE